jgi:hypothetical protein
LGRAFIYHENIEGKRIMRFRNEGIAFAHLTLPPDSFAREAEQLSEKLKALGKNYKRHRLAYLTGQADLLLELRLPDLRLAFQLDYESNATGTNWLFAIPFDHAAHDHNIKPQALTFTYVIHLRVNRDLYRAVGAIVDCEVVEAIVRLARGELTAEVSAGFGWSDILVSGVFAKRRHFVEFLTALHHLRINCEGERDAFSRILTVIGYPTNINFAKVQSDEVLHPVTFIRTLPTHIAEASDFAEWKNAGSWRKVVLDGKWDLVILPASSEGVPAKSFLQHHYGLITGGGLKQAGIQRLETHLLAQEESERTATAPYQHDKIATACACSSAVRSERVLLGDPRKPNSSAALLPRSLVIAIRNVLNLFYAASREGNTCCDIVPSLVRCEIGLDRLLRHHRALHERMMAVAKIDAAPGSPSASWWSPHVVHARNDIEDWCTYAERIVSQRTVGRFEEFLTQSERVVSYRGGIQKLLYLTDALLNSYGLRAFRSGEEPAFISLFDPIDLVKSIRHVGFVRVPVRYVFLLPLTIAHLWHEVGVHAFYAKYLMPFDSRTRRRVVEEFSKVQEPDATRLETVDLLVDLADVYADAVTLIKGFRGDLKQFIVSISSTLLEADAFSSAPGPVESRFWIGMLMRLYLALEFRQRYSFVQTKLRSESMTLDRLELDAWVPDPTVFVAPAVARIATILRNELLDKPAYLKYKLTRELENAAIDTIGVGVNMVHRRYLSELAWELAPDPLERPSVQTVEAFKLIMDGEVLPLAEEVDINDLFLMLQQRMISELREVPYADRDDTLRGSTFLKPVAALVRSSLLAFYKRDGGRRQDSGSPVLSTFLDSNNEASVALTELDAFDEEDVDA